MIVWLASYPRSGNTFFRVFMHAVFNVKSFSLYDDKLDIAADAKTSAVVGHDLLPDDFDIEKARKSDVLYLIKTHDMPENDFDKAIYLLRDGRESSLSFMNYLNSFGEYKKSLLDVIYGMVPFGGWADHVQSWAPMSRPNTILIKFEDLIDRPVDFIKPISDFLSLKEKGNDIPGFEDLKKINPLFFRSGKKDSWKSVYTKGEHLSFWSVSYEQMLDFGYDDNVPNLFRQDNVGNNKFLSLVKVQREYFLGLMTDVEERHKQRKNKYFTLQKEIVTKRDALLKKKWKEIADLTARVEVQCGRVAELGETIAKLEATVAERDGRVAELGETIAKLEATVAERIKRKLKAIKKVVESFFIGGVERS